MMDKMREEFELWLQEYTPAQAGGLDKFDAWEAAWHRSSQERGEAVAWMCQYSGSCWFTQSEVRAEMHRKAGWDVTPVYAHPTPDAGRVAELEKKLGEQRRISVELNDQCVDYCRRIAALEAQLAESREREGRMREALEECVCALEVCGKDYRATEIGRAALAADKEGE